MSAPVSPGLRSGSLPLLVALMTLLAGLSLAGLAGVQTLAESWSGAARNATTIEIPSDTPQLADRTHTLIHTLTKTPDVTTVRELSTKEVQTLLAPWLGQVSESAGLPGLSLPVVLIVAHTGTPDLGTIVHGVLPEAVVEEDRRWGERLNGLGNSLIACAWLAVSLIAAIAVLSVGMTVRRSVMAQRKSVEIVHFLGAGDLTISSRIAGRAALLSLAGSLVGLLLLSPVITMLARKLTPFSHGAPAAAPAASTWDALIATWWSTLHVLPRMLLEELGALPLIAAGLGWLTAQTVVLVWLRRLP
ncbi:cell division protein FtsX [Gluconobacter albidus]|uniref:cell division protein FtsX n=1 Tax=Gluconobacter albidus TaxID=318683 RepID=UPI00098AC9EF|nr:FtsX-like permease family protein [Gluconobacter albidus]AQS90995.1 cell division protein FtsX [Gluconobacter albidus]